MVAAQLILNLFFKKKIIWKASCERVVALIKTSLLKFLLDFRDKSDQIKIMDSNNKRVKKFKFEISSKWKHK